MYTIKKFIKNEIEINKSRFITLLYVVHNKDEVVQYLDTTKNNYPDATHYCYAYIIDNLEKASDDGEPSKTAGAPILNVLKQKKLNHVLCIVVRYFGGVKLGAGGLVRAYSNSCSLALEKAEIASLVRGKRVRFSIDYNNIDTLNYLLQDEQIIYKEFSDKVIYEVLISSDRLASLGMFEYDILDDCYLTV